MEEIEWNNAKIEILIHTIELVICVGFMMVKVFPCWVLYLQNVFFVLKFVMIMQISWKHRERQNGEVGYYHFIAAFIILLIFCVPENENRKCFDLSFKFAA